MVDKLLQCFEVVHLSGSIASRIVEDKGVIFRRQYFLVDVGRS
jgi:hypothetical protein